MNKKLTFGQALLAARKRKGLSQQQLADRLPVIRSSVANWEADRRLPSATIMARIAEILGVDVTELLDAANENATRPIVIVVDDNPIVLSGSAPIIEEVLPKALVVCFSSPAQALEFTKENQVALAFLDIELGLTNGIDLCNAMIEVNPRLNVVFLTAHPDYGVDAWGTEASGFMVKPITAEGVKAQLKKLRHPFPTGGIVA